MASAPSQACPDCDCSDSPLSIVANLLSVLTFALGVTASFAAFTAVTRGAAKEMEDTRDVLRMTRQQIAQARQFLNALENRADPDLGMMRGLVGDSLQGFVAAEEEMATLLHDFRLARKGPSHGPVGLSFSSRMKWWYREKDLAAGMAKLREFQQHFAAAQLIFLER